MLEFTSTAGQIRYHCVSPDLMIRCIRLNPTHASLHGETKFYV